jgi:predicted outer membrane repeat protein
MLSLTQNLAISGPGPANLTIRSNAVSNLFYVSSGTVVSLSGVTLSDSTLPDGYGVFNIGSVTVNNAVFTGNTAYGILNYHGAVAQAIGTTFTGNSGEGLSNHGGVVTVTNSLFSDNHFSEIGGAASNDNVLTIINSTFAGNSGSAGGALYNASGRVTIMGSTFSGNSATNAGGAIYNNGTLTVTNSTFYSNTAATNGGAIANNTGVTLTVTNSTFVGNSGSPGGSLYLSAGTVALRNTIVANSPSGGNCSGAALPASNHNLSTDGTCSPGFTQVTAGQLALGSPTGSPAYLPLSAGSVAIDAGTNTPCPSPDQRGVTRPIDGNRDGVAVCDVGAFEAQLLSFLPLVRH